MLALTVALLLQMEPLEKGLETAKKESKPLVLFFHRNDWQGAEKIAAQLKEALADLADKFLLAEANVQANAEVSERYGVKRLDGGLAVLDPFEVDAAKQPIARHSELAPKPDSVKAMAVAGLKVWAERSAARGAVDRMWQALKKNDVDAFRRAIWQEHLSGERDSKKWFDEGVKVAAKWDHLEFKSVEAADVPEIYAKMDADLQRIFKVSFWFVDKDLKKNGTSFKVADTKAGWYVIWEN